MRGEVKNKVNGLTTEDTGVHGGTQLRLRAGLDFEMDDNLERQL
jgi:hypothetical protein